MTLNVTVETIFCFTAIQPQKPWRLLRLLSEVSVTPVSCRTSPDFDRPVASVCVLEFYRSSVRLVNVVFSCTYVWFLALHVLCNVVFGVTVWLQATSALDFRRTWGRGHCNPDSAMRNLALARGVSSQLGISQQSLISSFAHAFNHPDDTAKGEEVEEAAIPVQEVEEALSADYLHTRIQNILMCRLQLLYESIFYCFLVAQLDNDISMEPLTPNVLEQVVELSILLTGETYNDDLDNPASLQYQALSRQLSEKVRL